jgi:hypothetical protein
VIATIERRPKTLEEIRAEWEAELRAERGDAWMAEHAAMLDSQWEYLTECGFL